MTTRPRAQNVLPPEKRCRTVIKEEIDPDLSDSDIRESEQIRDTINAASDETISAMYNDPIWSDHRLSLTNAESKKMANEKLQRDEIGKDGMNILRTSLLQSFVNKKKIYADHYYANVKEDTNDVIVTDAKVDNEWKKKQLHAESILHDGYVKIVKMEYEERMRDVKPFSEICNRIHSCLQTNSSIFTKANLKDFDICLESESESESESEFGGIGKRLILSSYCQIMEISHVGMMHVIGEIKNATRSGLPSVLCFHNTKRDRKECQQLYSCAIGALLVDNNDALHAMHTNISSIEKNSSLSLLKNCYPCDETE